MNLRQLEVFHAIMRCGSITRAAQLLNVSQPAVSHSIRHYEDKLGRKLFERKGGALLPTQDALQMFPDVQQIFRRIEALERSMLEASRERSIPVSIAATPTISGGELPTAVAAYLRKNPGATVEIQSLKAPDVIELVSRQEVDFGLGSAPPADISLQAIALAQADVQCVVPVTHPLAMQAEVSVTDLHEVPIISYSRHAVLSAPIHRAFAELGSIPRIQIQTNDALSALLMVDAGLGIAVVQPSLAVSRLFRQLTAVPLYPRVSSTLSLLWSSSRPLSASSLELIEILKATCASPN